jgi:nucleotide-binding universal stress UspA family protein
MSLKTILVHLATDEHHRVRLDVGLRLAKAHQAHVVALFVTHPVGMPAAIAGRGASAAYLAEAQSIAREKAGELQAEFEQACSEQGISYTWRVEDCDHLEALSYHAHVADVTIVSQPPASENIEDWFRMRVAEEFTMISGSPVLVLPQLSEVPEFGRHIMIAWHGNKETVRAVRDGIGFLTAADKVSVVSIGDTPEDKVGEIEVVEHLLRHGVAAVPINVPAEGSIGEQLLAINESLGCDMIVMGAYGRSRMFEVITGGATRHVIQHAQVPVLMSH